MKFVIDKDRANILEYSSLNNDDKREAYAYIVLAEYDLFRMHSDNGISETEYGVHPLNIGKFVYDIRSYYDDKNAKSLIYLYRGLYRGFISHRKDPAKGEYIVSLYIDRDSRRKGIAELLIKKVIENTEENKVTVLVGDFNKGAISLYEKLGFKKLGDSNIHGMSEYQLILGGK